MRRSILACAAVSAVVVLVAFIAMDASGQSLDASVVVVGSPVSVYGKRDLNFGDVTPGSIVTVTINSTASGLWRVDGPQGEPVQLDLTLPAALSSGSNTMPIQFANDDAAAFWFNTPYLATRFDPHVSQVTNLRPFFSGRLYVWLGAQVAVQPSQAGGLYTAPVTLMVTYLGS